jgi:hypothetical protein
VDDDQLVAVSDDLGKPTSGLFGARNLFSLRSVIPG